MKKIYRKYILKKITSLNVFKNTILISVDNHRLIGLLILIAIIFH